MRRLTASEPDQAERRAGLLTTYYWPEVRRGTERLVHDLAAGLSAHNWSATIIHGQPGAEPVHTTEGERVSLAGVTRRPMRLARALRYTEELGHLRAMRRELSTSGCDVAHAFGLFEAAIAAGNGSDPAPLVFTVTGIPRRENVEGLFWRRRALARVARSAGAIVAISEAALERIAWMGGEQRVIHPGIDLDAFRRTRERAPHPTILCTASSADPRKRVPLVVEAFRELRRSLPSARLVLSTRAGERSSYGGEEGVELRVLDDHAALLDAYSEAWTSVIASTDEAFGLVAVESLACGTPVVASADAGLVEAVGGPGPHTVLVDDPSPSRLAKALGEGLELAPGDEECRRRADRFSVERSTAAYVALYEELLA